MCSTGAATGYFLHRPRDGEAHFVKVVPASHAARQHAADNIAAWLLRRGVKVISLLAGFPRQMDQMRSVFAYRFVVGRFAEATTRDLDAIGRAIARLHASLAELPDSALIRTESQARAAMLRNRANQIVVAAATPRLQCLRDLLQENHGLLALLDGHAGNQPIHGDLVYANVLFPDDGAEPLILDFEDTLISWLPPEFDLALAIERFAFLPAADEATAVLLGRALYRGYAKECGGNWNGPRTGLDECLRFLSLRALITLAELEGTETPVATTEWDKFFGLYDFAQSNRHLARAITEENAA